MSALTETVEVPISILRGGTSRGVFFSPTLLDLPREVLDGIVLNVMGSPDPRQINGLGGATPQTSKIAFVGASDRDDADVDYTFAQVDITRSLVDWGGNCGNISSAVGPYAVNNGLVEPVADGEKQTVRVFNTNTGKVIRSRFPVVGGRAMIGGDTRIAGVPFPGARVDLEFEDPTGAVTGSTLPTGNPRDVLTLKDGTTVEVSIVDAANPTVFVRPDAVGITGTESAAELDANAALLDRLEEIRSIAAVMLGLVDSADRATEVTPGLPKIGVVATPKSYVASDGTEIAAGDMDVLVRMMSMQHPHRACQITAGICTGVASTVPGTLVNEVYDASRLISVDTPHDVRLGHPSGLMITAVRGEAADAGLPAIAGVAVVRTARGILDGVVHVPRSLFPH
jgi:2-methylaconitate cis-trans-isomerase PrpF